MSNPRIRSRGWVFTFQNYESCDIDYLKSLFAKEEADYGFGEESAPSTGTPHLQGWVQFKIRRDFDVVRRILKHSNIRPMRGTLQSNIAYCSKEGKYHSNLRKPLPLMATHQLSEWQVALDKYLDTDPDDRTVVWIYDSVGHSGKSWFAKWYKAKYKDSCLISGKNTDILFLVASIDPKPRVIFYNVPRSTDGQFVSFQSIEQIKDGYFASGKYESTEVLMPSPHFVVFANFYPNTEKLTEDRWLIIDLGVPSDLDKLNFFLNSEK